MSAGRRSYRASRSSPRTTVKSADPERCGEKVLDSMWMPPIATLCGVRWPFCRGRLLVDVRRDHRQPAGAYVDGLAVRDPPWRRELRPVDPRAAHASKVAQ